MLTATTTQNPTQNQNKYGCYMNNMIKTSLLVFSGAVALSVTQPAYAVPGAADCEVLRYECSQGNEQKCRIVYRYCDIYYPENLTLQHAQPLIYRLLNH